MMVKLFNRGWHAVTLTTEAVSSSMETSTLDTPLTHLPKYEPEHTGTIGEDCNLPLLVRDLGKRKQEKLVKRKLIIQKELEAIDKELTQLDVLLDAANSL